MRMNPVEVSNAFEEYLALHHNQETDEEPREKFIATLADEGQTSKRAAGELDER